MIVLFSSIRLIGVIFVPIVTLGIAVIAVSSRVAIVMFVL